MRPISFLPESLKSDLTELRDRIRGRRILITGAGGFIGKSLLAALSFLHGENCEFEVTGVSRQMRKRAKEDPFLRSLDFLQAIDLDTSKEDWPLPACTDIIHAASPLQHQTTDEREIVNGAENLAKWASRNVEDRVLFLSSGAVYGSNLNGPCSENKISRTSERSSYGRAKLAAEDLLLDRCTNAKIARVFALSGPFFPRDGNFAICSFITNAMRGEPIEMKGNPCTVRSYLDSADMAVWMLKFVFGDWKAKVLNIGSAAPLTMKELAQEVSEGTVTSIEQNLEVIGDATAPVTIYYPDGRLAKELALFQKISLKESIERMISLWSGTPLIIR